MSDHPPVDSPRKTAAVVNIHVHDLWIGIDVRQVQEVIRPCDLTVVASAPDFVRGVINLRGEILTIVDLRHIIGLGPTPIGPDTRYVIVRSESELIGLLVDRVGDVVYAGDHSIDSAPDAADGPIAPYVSCVLTTEGDRMYILETDAALAASALEPAN